MTIQKHYFYNHGFVIHKITGDFSGKISAWFGPSGELLNCEQILPHKQISRPVKINGPIWKEIAKLGNIHKK